MYEYIISPLSYQLLILTRVAMPMDSLLATVLVICFIGTGLAVKPQRLTVRTSIFDTKPYPSHIRIPHSTCDDGIEDYDKVWIEEDLGQLWEFYCLSDDPRLCLIYDLNGFIAGIQISYLLDDLKFINQNVYNTSNPNFKDKIIFDTPVKSVPVFFTNPEELTVTGRLSPSNDIVDGLWAHLDGEWVRFDSKRVPNSPAIGDFNMQGCIPKMGQIFLRRFHENASCKDAFFLYLLYDHGRLVGFGHSIPGLLSPGPRTNVYSHAVDRNLIQNGISDPPPCFSDLMAYGFTTVGVWFIEDPWNIRCPKCYCN